MQNHYNLLYREEEREMVPTLKVRPSSYHSIPCMRLTFGIVGVGCGHDPLVSSRGRSPRKAAKQR